MRNVAEGMTSNSELDAIEAVLASGRCLRIKPGLDRATLVHLLDVLVDGGPAMLSLPAAVRIGTVPSRPIREEW